MASTSDYTYREPFGAGPPDSAPPFRIGGVVNLRSGGPPMTVVGLEKAPAQFGWIVYVAWINEAGLSQRDKFPSACLA